MSVSRYQFSHTAGEDRSNRIFIYIHDFGTKRGWRGFWGGERSSVPKMLCPHGYRDAFSWISMLDQQDDRKFSVVGEVFVSIAIVEYSIASGPCKQIHSS